MARYRVTLTKEEREALEAMTRSGNIPAKKFMHARALLLCDARLTALACSKPPEGRKRWTLRLLADKAVELKLADSVSTMTVQRSLKKTNCALT